ncbi:MAG: pilus assembly protein PilP [Candidatus Aminicenantes bacterium]|nr:pilus assembly protein PilP [Candidatus Aminicenantes bacterium]
MNRKIMILFLGFLGLNFFLSGQEQKDAATLSLTSLQSQLTIYNPEGRRDPFKNLLAGKEIKGKTEPSGGPELFIEDLKLIGIVKHKNQYVGIFSGPHGFPLYLRVGDRVSDGFVLSINESQVIFRKTNERGLPLMRPKDITKEIHPEER